MICIETYTCKQCGKVFTWMNIGEYQYKKLVNGIWAYFCGYNCLRKFEKEHVFKCEIRKRKKIAAELAGIVIMPTNKRRAR